MNKRVAKELNFVREKTGIEFISVKCGKFWEYQGKYFYPQKVYDKVLERVNKGFETMMPSDSEDMYYYLREFGPMCGD